MVARAVQSTAERAIEVLALADANPPEALDIATALAAEGHEAGDVAGEAMALRAVGLAARNLGDIERSLEALTQGVELAESIDDAVLAAQVQTTLGPTLLYAGRSDEAIAVLEAAAGALEGVDRAKALSQLGGVMARMTRFPEAAEILEKAAGEFEAAGDDEWLAHVLTNLGLVNAYASDLNDALRNTLRARDIYDSIGHSYRVGNTTHNLGFIAMKAGRIGEALRHFEEAEQILAELDQDLGELLTDHCEALMAAGVYSDAVVIARRCVESMSAGGMEVGRAEAELMLSHAAFLAGEYEAAEGAAQRANSAFADQQRPGWAAHAEFCRLRAQASMGKPVDEAYAIEVADRLDRGRQRLAAQAARVIAGRIALDNGRLDVARAVLSQAADARRSTRLDLKVNAWTAEALLRNAENDRRATLSALRAGMSALEDLGASLGSTDARLGVQALGADLMELALAVNLGRSPAVASEWIERIALHELDFRPVVPNPVPEMEEALSRLRSATAELRGASLEAAPIRALQSEINRQVSSIRRSRLAQHDLGDARLVLERAKRGLGSKTLVQFAISEGRVHAVVTNRERRRAVDCADWKEVSAKLDLLRFQIALLARYGSDGRRSVDLVNQVLEFAEALDSLLLGGIRGGDDELVLAPPRMLLGVPWNLLPSLGERPVTVTPSVRTWLNSSLISRRATPAVVVAGPDLEGAEGEASAVAGVLADPSVVAGDNATATTVRSLFEGVGLVHVVAHGAVIVENPMLSSLRVADGPLMLYDLETLVRPPATVVLSACDSGRVATERLAGVGIATALLGLGVRTVVASTTVIPDTALTTKTMVRLHEHLAEVGASQALWLALGELGDSPEALLLRGFAVFGA